MRTVAAGLTALALVATLSACHHRGGSAGGWEPTTQTRAQYAADLDQRFARMDRNNDGAIQPDELQGRRGGGGGNGAGAGGGNDSGGRDGNGGGGGGGRSARMMRMDTDHDGEISRSEFTAGSLAQFDRADANHDGTATVEEWQAMRQHMRDGHGGDANGNAAAPAPGNATAPAGNTAG